MYMKNPFLSLAAGVVFLTLAVPAAASAAQAPSAAHYSTSMTELYGGNSPYTGALDITVSANGIVNGYYFPADYSTMFVPVVGGKNGDSIWLDIGSSQITHVEARVEDGALVGTAFTSANAQYTFVAKPTAQSAR
jgi:hypothetical protein